MYSELIEKLKTKEVVFDEGLDSEEIKNIESAYDIKFPKELKEFYMCALPISEGFYNWRDLSKGNIERNKSVLMTPILDFKQEIDCIEWSDLWGEEPDNEAEKNIVIMEKLDRAPILIPLFKHRYISSQFDEGNPVFSIYEWDIICYGENLTEYFNIEFGFKNHSTIEYEQIKKVDFWSDLL